MRPISVCVPVPTTTPRALPERTTVPINAHAPKAASAPRTHAATLSAGIDSPVSIASSQASPCAVKRRRSAGTISPTASVTTSPGTNSDASISHAIPSRCARAMCRTCARRSAIARTERYSLTKPRPTLSTTIARMITASVRSCKMSATIAVAASNSSNGFLSCPSRTSNGPVVRSRSTLTPKIARRETASADVSPSRDTPSRMRTSAASTRSASRNSRIGISDLRRSTM